ncbi:GNAT family N-acetyltransferase [Lachnospiraceae bacterium ZAX-1]
MNITYSNTKDFSSEDLHELFKSVNWLSANYAERLVVAMKNSDFVFSAWDGKKLVGLLNVLDDTIMTAYIHYLLVNSAYQGKGIGTNLVEEVKEVYKSFLYIVLISEDIKTLKFFEKNGIFITEDSFPMSLMNRNL